MHRERLQLHPVRAPRHLHLQAVGLQPSLQQSQVVTLTPSEQLFAAWNAGPASEQARAIAKRIPVPGSIALRGRFHLLSDGEHVAESIGSFALDEATWRLQIELTERADAALVSNDVAGAQSALEQLRASVAPDAFPLPIVDALVGLGCAAHQADDLEQAIHQLGAAKELASTCGYRFGAVRALLSLGYVTMRVRSLAEALAQFEQAAHTARELDERLFLANALIGSGEANSRLRNDTAAINALEEAISICRSIRSWGGIVNAAQHLGDLHRRRREFEPARTAFLEARHIAVDHGPWIGVVNATDGLGEVLIGLGAVDDAIAMFEESLAMSEEKRYERGAAHAYNGLGRAAYVQQDWQRSAELHGEAYRIYLELGDLSSATTALDGMARAAEAVEDWSVAVDCRLAAVDAIEQLRAAQDSDESQAEYRKRFDQVYSRAMRTALHAQHVPAFVATFEGIAGRRLAGLVERLPGQAAVGEAQLLSGLTSRSFAKPGDGSDLDDVPRPERVARLLGRHTLRGTLPDLTSRALDDIAAALYRPFDATRADPLLAHVAQRSDVFLVCQVPGSGEIAWLRTRQAGAVADLGVAAPGDEVLDLIDAIAADGLPVRGVASLLQPLRDVFPDAAIGADSADSGLTVVPLGALWALPWVAFPAAESEVLGERFALGVLPSLTLAGHLTQFPTRTPRTVAHWRSPLIHHHRLEALVDDHRIVVERLSRAEDGVAALVESRHDLVLIAGHGRPAPGIGHYLELDEDVLLDPTGFLGARTPSSIALLACWGAHRPGPVSSDPLTLATVALTRSTTEVLATIGELADDPIASRLVNDILHRWPAGGAPVAVRDALRRFLPTRDNRSGMLSRWAPLVTLGLGET